MGIPPCRYIDCESKDDQSLSHMEASAEGKNPAGRSLRCEWCVDSNGRVLSGPRSRRQVEATQKKLRRRVQLAYLRASLVCWPSGRRNNHRRPKMPKYLFIQRSMPRTTQQKAQQPSPAQMQEIYAAFNACKEKFKENIVTMAGKLKVSC